MDINSSSSSAAKEGVSPCLSQSIRILLVDHDTTSLMSLASQFEQQLYEVTSIESAKIALLLFQERNNYYDIVIADISMPEMGIYEFVEKLKDQRMTVPIILISEELTMNLAREAIGHGVCYVFSKPPIHRDISTVWLHIARVTGKMPALFDKTNSINMDTKCNPSSVARNQKQKNLKLKLINTDKEKMKRKKNPTAENFSSSSDTKKEDAHNSKKPRLTWTPDLHKKFLNALNTLGEQGAKPKTILRLMNEPNLTPGQVNSHFQNYRNGKRQSLNLQETTSPVMPAVLHEAPLNIVMEGQTYATASSNTTAAPNSVHYSFESVKQNQDAFNYSSNNSTINTNINNDGNAENVVEGTNGSNQQFDGMSSVDDLYQMMQDLETSGVKISDLLN
ncbi:hypothetical protein POM88_027581 [Heracleum sosnowskyi]|uniref:Two-component response regulator n=1 Tax=Heracleum sosnowskyi TaxID=360622 RepID=A0AAD8MQ27_9APIA|nr:hypothetical protein POM88_027581 [Heracleum sosnowskyi]